jgi:threonyl-tRNA synthetase
MINITFLDGSIKQFAAGVSGLDVAAGISKSLEKKALAVKINGKIMDLATQIHQDANVAIITPESAEGLDILRHDAAHIMAQALTELYDGVQLAIGPTIENGFYYDFCSNHSVSEEDFPAIEKRMKEISERNLPIKRVVMSRQEAAKHFSDQQQSYKIKLLEAIPEEEEVTVYIQGSFDDLCRGPHAPSTGKTKFFKLLKVAGAYWRGDSSNEMLQRIYGTAWDSQESLDAYLHQLEEAEKRDHRKIGKEMDLFHFQDDAPGAVFWHPNGWQMFQNLVNYMRKRQQDAGYLEINTPEVMDKSLWEKSGHWEKFGHNMFTAMAGDEKKVYAVKPMNCPGCVQVYKSHLRSYRDLPMRLSEFGKVHRYEPSGALHGLMRVRAFTQDDAHVFCTPDQLMNECKRICDQMLLVYRDFGFEDIKIKFSDRPEKRIGSDEVWDKAESALKHAAEKAGLQWTLNPGEGAFYGPKLEFTLRDAIGRDWQIGTLQVDLNLPERLGAHYIAEDGQRYDAVMLHQAIFGSLERFTGILIEHYAGRLPLWISPVQVVVASITNDVEVYAKRVYNTLRDHGVRVGMDLDNEKISYKIRKHSLAKAPVMLILGRNEAEADTVAVRRLGQQEPEVMPLQDFVAAFALQAAAPL